MGVSTKRRRGRVRGGEEEWGSEGGERVVIELNEIVR